MLGCDLGGGAISAARTQRCDFAGAFGVGCDLAHSFSLSLSPFLSLYASVSPEMI